MKYSNKDKYKGGWKQNKREGSGTYLFANRNKYTGNFKNDFFNNDGMMVYANGDRYKARWKEGKKEGKGVIFYDNPSASLLKYLILAF